MLFIERDEDGYYVASVPQIPVTERIREAIELCLGVDGGPEDSLEFVGIQRVTVAA